jgi:hypothetical protein
VTILSRLVRAAFCFDGTLLTKNHRRSGTNNDLALYSSPDLSNDGWTLENPSLVPADQRPNGIYFRPKMLWNEPTEKFVLWFNFVTETRNDTVTCSTAVHWPRMNFTSPFCHSTYGTATSTNVEGPFGSLKLPIAMGSSKLAGRPGHSHGDFNVFVEDDEDRSAYVLYNSYDAGPRANNAIDLLSADYTESTLKTSGYMMAAKHGAEAQAMIKRRGRYFVLLSAGCCFCAEGSSTKVLSATKDILNETSWNPTTTGKLGINGAVPRTIAAQQSFIIQLPDVGQREQWLWGGDRWHSGNKIENGGVHNAARNQSQGYKSADAMVWVSAELPLILSRSTCAVHAGFLF